MIFKRSGLVWALLACLVLMNGLMVAPGAAHAEHHGTHHDAGMHAGGICAWFCAAGQEVESASVDFDPVLQVVGRVEPVLADLAIQSTSEVLFLGGPPAGSR